MPTVKVNEFAKRQVRGSGFSYSILSWDCLADLTEARLEKARKGYTEGVLLVPIPPEVLRTSIVPIDKAWSFEIETEYKSRRDGELPLATQYVELTHIECYLNDSNGATTLSGEVVVYSRELLGNDASTNADYEIVSINAYPTLEPTPMHPTAMARNFLEMEGGTKGSYSAEDFAKSIIFWSTHVQTRDTPLELTCTPMMKPPK